MLNLLNARQLIEAGGYTGIFAVIFAETGLLVGFFLPGDSLLFTAGFLASIGYLNIAMLLVVAFAAAVIGDSVGYFIGRRYGVRVFSSDHARFFKKEYREKAEAFYAAKGGSALVLGRFMPIVRTAVPVFAGIAQMRYRHFFAYNIVGGALWTLGLGLFGYFFGKVIPSADKYVLPIIAVIVIVSIAPSAIAFWRQHKK